MKPVLKYPTNQQENKMKRFLFGIALIFMAPQIHALSEQHDVDPADTDVQAEQHDVNQSDEAD